MELELCRFSVSLKQFVGSVDFDYYRRFSLSVAEYRVLYFEICAGARLRWTLELEFSLLYCHFLFVN